MADEGDLQFTAMGCGPYHQWMCGPLKEYLRRIGPGPEPDRVQARSELLFHLGDLFSHGLNEGPPALLAGQVHDMYRRARELLQRGAYHHLPVLAVPGDNDWHGFPWHMRRTAWRDWEISLLGMVQGQNSDLEVARQGPRRRENFAFTRKGVRFVGIHRIAVRSFLDKAGFNHRDWRHRLQDDREWIEAHLISDATHPVRAIVMLAHTRLATVPGDDRARKRHRDWFATNFLEPVLNRIAAFGRPTLYLHADRHEPTSVEGANPGAGIPDRYLPWEGRRNLWEVGTASLFYLPEDCDPDERVDCSGIAPTCRGCWHGVPGDFEAMTDQEKFKCMGRLGFRSPLLVQVKGSEDESASPFQVAHAVWPGMPPAWVHCVA